MQPGRAGVDVVGEVHVTTRMLLGFSHLRALGFLGLRVFFSVWDLGFRVSCKALPLVRVQSKRPCSLLPGGVELPLCHGLPSC